MSINTLAYPNGLFPDSNGRVTITFYAICILGGALLALFLSNYHAHKDGYDWTFFDTIFLVAFPAGIIGARIWYVIATWPETSGMTNFFGYGSNWVWKPFAIWEGGLAIQGGAIAGVLAGMIFIKLRRKGTHILRAADFAVPTIIVAQAVGRWGNFFNQEVFGHAVSAEAWNFLPSFITSNMQNGGQVMLSGVMIPKGSVAAPLFLIEGVINVMFYFLISYGLKALEGKHYEEGDTTFAYFIAYGIIRAVLEPLRNPAFIMGEGSNGTSASRTDFKSYMMALAFVAIGLILIFLNHLVKNLSRKGKLDNVPIISRFTEKHDEATRLDIEEVRKEDERKSPESQGNSIREKKE